MARVRIRRNQTTGQVATPAGALEGELVAAHGGFSNLPGHPVAGNDVVIFLNGAYRTVVGPLRQVEVIGAQNVTGAKTFSDARFAGTNNIDIGGGDLGQVLTSNGTGAGISWQDPSGGGITVILTDSTLDGDGITTALSVTIARPGQRGGVVPVAGSAIDFNAAGGLSLLVANEGLIAGGANNVLPITPLGLRDQTRGNALADFEAGLPVGIVPAINFLKRAVDALQGQLHFGGAWDAANDEVTASTTPGNPFTSGDPLPDPPTGSEGWFLIVTSAMTIPPGEIAPEGIYGPGDWLIVDGGLSWVHIPLGAAAVHVDNDSIKGDGLTPLTAFYVDNVDGGQFP